MYCHKNNTKQTKLREYFKLNMEKIQAFYRQLFKLGFNIFPQPVGEKGGYPWKKFQYTRLHPNHNEYGLDRVFAGDTNIAIMCGRTSGNLFVLDCEDEDSFQYHINQMQNAIFPYGQSELLVVGISTCVLKTGKSKTSKNCIPMQKYVDKHVMF